jgi:hypothetical protein
MSEEMSKVAADLANEGRWTVLISDRGSLHPHRRDGGQPLNDWPPARQIWSTYGGGRRTGWGGRVLPAR